MAEYPIKSYPTMTFTSQSLDIRTTADGSATLYRSDIDEHYHSVKGALSESLHVYIDMGWRKGTENKRALRVFEVGFGTGLNAALTAAAAIRENVDTEYYSIELYPLTEEVSSLMLNQELADCANEFEAVNNARWDEETAINSQFRLFKINGNLLTTELPHNIDVVYFDAFAPDKQPEMWNEDIFRRLHAIMNPGGVLTTYCAKGIVRRTLRQIGFRTERLPGPENGKREILRATKV